MSRPPAGRAGSQPLLTTIRSGLYAVADPERAPGMQAYMKSPMPFLGVGAADRRRVVRAAVASHPFADRAGGEAAVRTLWNQARFREERYAAVDLLATAAARPWHDPGLLPLLRHLIVEGAWWDHVDELAIHHVGPVLARHRDAVTPTVLGWAREPDRWLRRSSVLCQVGLRDDVDTALLTETIDANAADPDFFLRKAIGWALRTEARRNPEWVRAFVAAREDTLSALSKREALKHL